MDFFFAKELNFRVIVVEQEKLKYDQFKDGDEELGFYTFYYEMLIKWLNQPVIYNLLLDFKKNQGSNHYGVLQRCLINSASQGTKIKGVNVISSADSPLAQLSDLLVGATAASWCGMSPDTAKTRLATYIAGRLGWNSLQVASVRPVFSKFNIFKIDLQ